MVFVLGFCDRCECECKNSPKRILRAAWLEEFTWFRNKNGCAYYGICEKKFNNHVSYLRKQDSIKTRIQNWEKKKNLAKIEHFMGVESNNLCRQVYQAELTLVMFLICHNLLFVLMDYLPRLLVECCPDSNIDEGVKCARTKTSQHTEVLGKKLKIKCFQN